MQQKPRGKATTKRRRKKSKKQPKGYKWIPYLIVGLFTYTLYTTQFFHFFYNTQREAYQRHLIQGEQSTPFDFSTPSHVVELVTNIQTYLTEIMTNIDLTHMYSFLSDGFALGGTQSQLTASGDYRFNYTRTDTSANEKPTISISDDPLVYLFNSHTEEWFEGKEVNPDLGRVLNVVDLSQMMAGYFEQQGINAIVEERSASDLVREKGWGYSRSYQASRIFLEEAVKRHDSLQFFFDMHRDSVHHNRSTVEINGNPFAQVFIVIGTEHDNYEQNYAMAEHIHQMLNIQYPGLSKGVVPKGGAGVNGVYNQDFASTLLVIEVGGVDNTYEEIRNTAQALVNVLTEYIKGG